MDIIAAHQQGLIEQLDAEVADLAGLPRNHGQRAIVLHHLYDHSRGSHCWAILEARQALRIADRLAMLERRLSRWGWTIRDRATAKMALDALGDALGRAGRARMITAYLAYRLSATAALRGEAEQAIAPALLGALDRCHEARRETRELSNQSMELLSAESQALADGMSDQAELAMAWQAIAATGLGRAAERSLGAKSLAKATARDIRRGLDRVEIDVRRHRSLPAAFNANPAQHFYALQLGLAERRRQQWRHACDRDGDAVALAA